MMKKAPALLSVSKITSFQANNTYRGIIGHKVSWKNSSPKFVSEEQCDLGQVSSSIWISIFSARKLKGLD